MRDLTNIFEPVVESMGYELVGVEYVGAGSGSGVLRIYIDRDAGVDQEDCAAISHQLSGILEVEDPIPQAYDLEVSSPGIDRPLFKLADFDHYAGNQVKIKLAVALIGRKNFRGELQGSTDAGMIKVLVDGELFEVPYADIAKANLVGID